jgi:hypothetical protein
MLKVLFSAVTCRAGIGFTTHEDKSDRLPGWDAGSWGYHGDDGNLFEVGKGVRYGPKFGTGSTARRWSLQDFPYRTNCIADLDTVSNHDLTYCK